MLFSLFAELQDFEVDLAAVVLKVNTVLPGTSSGETLPPGAVAAHTTATLRGLVPDEVAGIAFLSRGQSPATLVHRAAADSSVQLIGLDGLYYGS